MVTTATATNWRVAGRALGAGKLYGGLSIPGAAARLVLHSDGSPDATLNPNAFHIGGTKAGSKLMAKATRQDFFIDELPSPIDGKITAVEMAISCELEGVVDTTIMELMTAGFGTKTSGAQYEQVTFGTLADVFNSIALIWPTREDPTKFAVWHLYKAIADSGLDFTVNDKDMSFNPTNFRGYAISTRAAADQIGAFWKQVT